MREFEPGGAPRSSWIQWKRAFEIYLEVAAVTDDRKKRTLLLHCGGIQLQNVFYGLPETEYEVREGTGQVRSGYETAIMRLDEYFAPKLNAYYERHLFRNLKQEEGETFDGFYLRVERKSKDCDYHKEEISREIVVQIIEGCRSKRLRSKLLEKVRSLDEVVQICRSSEEVEQRVRSFEPRSSQEVQKVEDRGSQRSNSSKSYASIRCHRCGYTGHMSKDKSCPAWGKTCNNCKEQDHFESTCRRSKKRPQPDPNNGSRPPKRVRAVTESSKDYNYAFHIHSLRPETVGVKIGGVEATVTIDSGTNKTIITHKTYEYLKRKNFQLWNQRQGTDKTFMSYSSKEPLEILGQFTTKVKAGTEEAEETIYVCAGGQTDLLGKEISIKLKLLKLGYEVQLCASMNHESEFPKIPNVKAMIDIDTSVKPVVQRHRTIPFSMIKKVEDKLDKLCRSGIIEQVHGFTPWLSPIVPVLKSDDDIRLCVDMRMANKAIRKEEFPLPNIDTMLATMGKAKIFSKIDLEQAFYHIELDKKCRYITAFATQDGNYQFTRLMFGIKSAPGIFAKTMHFAMKGLKNTLVFMDDIGVYGETELEHDECLEKVKERLAELNLTISLKKSVFGVKELDFLGYHISDEGNVMLCKELCTNYVLHRYHTLLRQSRSSECFPATKRRERVAKFPWVVVIPRKIHSKSSRFDERVERAVQDWLDQRLEQ